jgi:hypothetical protein
MKRLANPGEGEIPAGASEVPGGGPQAYTDPDTGERVIDVEAEAEDMSDKPLDARIKATKPSRRRK